MAHRTVTVAASGGDYTTFAGAIAGEVSVNPNITALSTDTMYGVPVALEIQLNAIDDTAAVYVNGITTDATHWLLITVPSLYRHTGVWNGDYYNLSYSSAAYGVLTVDTNYTILDGLQVYNPSTGKAFSGAAVLLNCLLRSEGSIVTLGGPSTLNNCVFDGGTIYSEQIVSGTVTFENCTIVNNTSYGYVNNGGTCVIKNCYSGGNTELDFLGVFTFVTSACEDAITATGLTSGVAYDTATFESITSTDATYLKPTVASDLTDAGTDLSADAAWYLESVDVGGAASGTWDIGAREQAESTQKARPASDIDVGTWEKSPLPVGTDLYGKISELVADDANFIYSASSPVNDTVTLGLSVINTPAAGTVTIRVRASTY